MRKDFPHSEPAARNPTDSNKPGTALVRAYFARQRLFALRSVSYRFEDEQVTRH